MNKVAKNVIAKKNSSKKSPIKKTVSSKASSAINNAVPVLELRGVTKSYGDIHILKNVNIRLMSGQSLALVGTSGCGKSTLLHIAGLLDDPTGGTVRINGDDVRGISDKKRTKIRNNYIGFIYQFHNLLPEFSVMENVAYPMWIAGVRKKDAKQKALGLLKDVDMDEFADKRVSTLSGGQAQRVAIARALANNPKVVLADEPTGNLDDENSNKVWQVLIKAVKKQGAGLLCVTHDMEIAKKTDIVFTVESYTINNKVQ